MRNLYLLTGQQAVFHVSDFCEWQKGGRAFTPFPNRPEVNDFNYAQTLKYGQSNNRFWNLSPGERGSMMEFVGYRNVKLDKRGMGTVFYCEV